MAAIAETVISSTMVLVVNKCRDAAAEQLKEGGLTKQKIRGLIEREIHDIKSKLEGVARTDLLTAIDSFEVGLRFLYEANDARCLKDVCEETARAEKGVKAEQSAVNSLSPSASLVEAMKNIDLPELDERTTRAITNAKERFKMARERAAAASNSEALSTCDRIASVRYRVMAAILEALNNPEDALPECKYCLEKLHSLPEVRDSFKTELNGGWLNKEDRREIICTVCHINRVIYDVTQSAGKEVHLWIWPPVDTRDDKVDPLRDARVSNVLQKQGMEHCCVTPWSFGQEGAELLKLKSPWRIANNTQDDFILADNKECSVKVFDAHGKFLYAFPQPNEGKEIYDVAADREDNIYVLCGGEKPGSQEKEYWVFVKGSADQQHRVVSLRKELLPWSWYLPSLTINSNNKVLVRGKSPGGQHVVDVYENDGHFVRSFGAEKLKNPTAIARADDGKIMVVDEYNGSHYVRMFSEHGQHLFKFKVGGSLSFVDVAFYSEHVIVAGIETGKHCLRVLVYTKDGRAFVRSTKFNVEGLDCLRGITVNMKGCFGIIAGFLREHPTNPDSDSFITPSNAFLDGEHDYKVLVV